MKETKTPKKLINSQRHRKNITGVLLRRLAGQDEKDKTGLMVRALDRIETLLKSRKRSDWEIGLKNINALLPFAIKKESNHPSMIAMVNGSENENAGIFLQINNYFDNRETRKREITPFKELTLETTQSPTNHISNHPDTPQEPKAGTHYVQK